MRVIGTMRVIDERRGAIRAEDVYETGIEDLWEACTSPERLARWMAEVSGDLREGGVVDATFTSSWSGPARIDVCEAPSHLVVTLEPDTEDETQVEAWLTAQGERTRLVVEERGLPLPKLHFHGAGWQAHLEDLGRSLAGQPSTWKARWDELTPVYQDLSEWAG